MNTAATRLTEKFVAALKPDAARVTEFYDTEVAGLFVRVQPSGTRAFYLNKPGRKRVSLGRFGTLSCDQARQLARDILAEARVEKLSPLAAAKLRATKVPTLERFIDDTYAPHIEARNKSAASTLERLRKSFRELLPCPLDEIGMRFEKWRTKRLTTKVLRGKELGAPAGRSTVNRDTNALRALLQFAVDEKVLPHHPLAGVKKLKVDTGVLPRWLTTAEQKRLLNAAGKSPNENLLRAVTIFLNTGLRRKELLTLDAKSVDFKRRKLTVVGTLSKSGKTRMVPLNDAALAALKEFPLPYDGELRGFEMALKRLFIRAGIEAGAHSLRHTFARRLITASVPLPEVQRLLGHASLATTSLYVTADDDALKAAVNKLNF